MAVLLRFGERKQRSLSMVLLGSDPQHVLVQASDWWLRGITADWSEAALSIRAHPLSWAVKGGSFSQCCENKKRSSSALRHNDVTLMKTPGSPWEQQERRSVLFLHSCTARTLDTSGGLSRVRKISKKGLLFCKVMQWIVKRGKGNKANDAICFSPYGKSE